MARMGRHRVRREELGSRPPESGVPAPADDPLRLTPGRAVAGILAPTALLFLGARAAPLWGSAPWFVVLCAAEIVLFLLAFLPPAPPRWVDRWHGRLLVVGSVLGGCASVVFVPVSVVSLVQVFVGVQSRPGPWGWGALAGLVLSGPLLVATTRAYWRTADGLARRAFGSGPRLSRRALERTFE